MKNQALVTMIALALLGVSLALPMSEEKITDIDAGRKANGPKENLLICTDKLQRRTSDLQRTKTELTDYKKLYETTKTDLTTAQSHLDQTQKALRKSDCYATHECRDMANHGSLRQRCMAEATQSCWMFD